MRKTDNAMHLAVAESWGDVLIEHWLNVYSLILLASHDATEAGFQVYTLQEGEGAPGRGGVAKPNQEIFDSVTSH